MAFEPERGFLRAKATVTLRAGERLEAIELELNPHLTIQEVTDAQGRKLAFDRSRRIASPRLLVRLAEPVAADQEITLTFAYEGVPLLGGLDYISKDGILLRDESRWYPAVDLAAFTDFSVNVNLAEPRGWWVAASTGQVSPWNRTFANAVWHSFKASRRISSRSIVATRSAQPCGPLKDGRPIKSSPPLQYEVRTCFSEVLGVRGGEFASWISAQLQANSTLLGPSRWPGLVLVQGFPGQRGPLGYSAPGFLVVSEDAIKWAGVPGYAPEFLPHEIAHQWFPIEVTIAREEDGWLAESLAEYLAWRYLQQTDPAAAQAMVAQAMRDSLAPEPLRPLRLGLRLFASEDWEVARATLYQRGLLVFRTLETVIDRERLDRALQEYYKRYAGRSASVDDFRKICEEISGRDLKWFFDYFLDGTRIPEIELRRLPSTAPGEVLGEIVVHNVPPEFTARVEMRIHTTKGPVDHSVATRGEVTPFSASVAGQVTGITLDPDARILRWTDAARRNRTQRGLLAGLRDLEAEGQFAQALVMTQQALDADAENLANNQQQIRFARGRLYYRLGQWNRAMDEFGRALELATLDQPSTDFYRAWARVYRARIALRQGNPAKAGAEAKAGLAIKAPALDSEVAWLDARGRQATARAELGRLARVRMKE